MSRKLLGIDIRREAVAAVLLSSGLKRTRVESRVYLPIAEADAFTAAVGRNLEAISGQMDLSGAVLIAGIPGDEVSYRNIRVPFSEQRKIRQVLPFELETTLPVPIEDLIIDFHAVPSADPQSGSDLITGSIGRRRVADYLELFTAAGLDPEVVTLSTYTLVLCLARLSDRQGSWILIDTGPQRAMIALVQKGHLMLLRSLSYPLTDLSGASLFCDEVERTRLFCEARYGEEIAPEKIVFTGPEAVRGDLLDTVSDRLQIPVRRSTLFGDAGLTASDGADPDVDSTTLDTALSLSLSAMGVFKGLNFRRDALSPKRRWMEHKGRIIRTAILAAAALLLALSHTGYRAYRLQTDINRLDRQIADVFKNAFPEVRRIVDPLQQMRVKISEARRDLDPSGATENAALKIDVLRALSSQIPEGIDVELTRLVIGPDVVQINGETDTFNAVDDIKGRIEKSELFKSVTISSATLEKSGTRVNFKMKVQM